MELRECAVHTMDQIIFVVRRGRAESLAAIARKAGALVGAIVPAMGTAPSELISLLGLDDNYMEVVHCLTHEHWTRNVLAQVSRQFNIKKAGNGIAMVLPITKACGVNALYRLKTKYTGLAQIDEKACEELHLMEKNYELLTIIVNRGYADDAMEVARKAGSAGGTILNARGASVQEATKLFGISIEPEKEMLLMLVETDKRDEIIKAVEAEVGLTTPGRGIAFSSPVSMAVGIASAFDKAPE